MNENNTNYTTPFDAGQYDYLFDKTKPDILINHQELSIKKLLKIKLIATNLIVSIINNCELTTKQEKYLDQALTELEIISLEHGA